MLLILLIGRQNCCLLFCQRLVQSAIFFYFKLHLILCINWTSLEKKTSVGGRAAAEEKGSHNVIKWSLERCSLWLMGNTLPGELSRLLMSQDACPHCRIVSSKQGAALTGCLVSLPMGLLTSEGTGLTQLNYLNVSQSQDKTHILQ